MFDEVRIFMKTALEWARGGWMAFHSLPASTGTWSREQVPRYHSQI